MGRARVLIQADIGAPPFHTMPAQSSVIECVMKFSENSRQLHRPNVIHLIL